MNIELDEVVVQEVSDCALELATGGAHGGLNYYSHTGCITHCFSRC